MRLSHKQRMMLAANDMINIKWEVNSHSVDPLTQHKNTKWELIDHKCSCFRTCLHENHKRLKFCDRLIILLS